MCKRLASRRGERLCLRLKRIRFHHFYCRQNVSQNPKKKKNLKKKKKKKNYKKKKFLKKNFEFNAAYHTYEKPSRNQQNINNVDFNESSQKSQSIFDHLI